MANFQLFPDAAHEAEFERCQGHTKIDDKYPLQSAHGCSTYDLHDKKWIPHIRLNNPSNFKAVTKKLNQERMFFDWKNQIEKYS